MDHADNNLLSGCPVELTLSIIGGKWKGIIIFHLTTSGTIRYSEFQKRMPNITPRMLTKQLRQLEQDSVVHREVYPQVPPKVEYSLTEFGRTITPIVEQMAIWGNQYTALLTQEQLSDDLSSSKRVAHLKQAMTSDNSRTCDSVGSE